MRHRSEEFILQTARLTLAYQQLLAFSACHLHPSQQLGERTHQVADLIVTGSNSWHTEAIIIWSRRSQGNA